MCLSEGETRVSDAIILAFEGETMEIWDDNVTLEDIGLKEE